MDKRKQLCVVFDIDETLIHFVSKRYRSLWDNLNESIKSKFDVIDLGEGGDVIMLRPHINELFDYFKSKPEIKVALWTYSEREYSEHISKILSKKLNLPSDFFMFTWGAEDMETTEDYEASGLPKDLTKIYDTFPDFNTFNTFIVDDLYKNINHEINVSNSILIEPFAPFGTSKVRTDIGSEKQTILSNDTSFIALQEICEKSLRDILNCDSEDIDDSFDSESIFSPKRVKRMGLKPFLKTYAINFLHMMTIGDPMQTNDFILVNQDYGMHVKGGTRRRRRYKKGRRTRARRYRR